MTVDERTPETQAPETQAPEAVIDTPVSDSEPSIGQQLRTARERLGMTQADAANELKMPLLRVQALESDQFACLNSETFVRGYLRAYAKLLNLDVQQLLAGYLSQTGGDAQLPGQYQPVVAQDGSRSVWKLVLVVAVILLVLWVVSVWFLGNRSETGAVPGTVAVPPATDYGARAYSPAADAEPGAAENPPPLSEAAADPAQAPSDLAAESEWIAPLVEQASTPALDRLDFVIADECWLEVSDALGDVLYTNLVQAGRTLSLEGRAPFQLKIGNAQAVQIRLNDEPVALNITPATRLLTVTLGDN